MVSESIDVAVTHQVGQPARRGDQNVDAGRDLLDLTEARHAAQHQRGRDMRALGEHADRLFDLHGEFAGRREDQRTGRLRPALGAERDDLRQDRQRESRRLARTGLGDAQHVPAFKLRRDGLDLDRLGLGEAGGIGGLEQRAGNSEFGETFELPQCFQWSIFNLFFFHAAPGRKHHRGRAQPAVEKLFMKRQGGGRIARSAALSCPQASCQRGSFAACRYVGKGENRRNQSHSWGKPDKSRPKRLCRRIWPSSPRNARAVMLQRSEKPPG